MTNIRYVKLETLKRIRDNNYESVYHKGRVYDQLEINREIARKEEMRERRLAKYKPRERP